ncbi:MAG: IS200/IS605 family transposase [Bacteroidota bacterium]|nr:IS200/IS605 family transposase [Bacteroidota bacterium]
MGSSYHQLYYHFVWGTYKRHELIDEEIEKDLERLIQDKIIENRSELLSFGCTTDHVHLLTRLHPVVSVSGIIGEVKGYSSYVMANQIHPESGFRWQGGFGALTASKRDLPGLIRYIENQKEHHNLNNLNQKWELNNSDPRKRPSGRFGLKQLPVSIGRSQRYCRQN